MSTINIINNTQPGTFTISAGSLTLSAGNFKLPTTASASVGTITINSTYAFHNYNGTLNAMFMGVSAGNFTLTQNYTTALGYSSGNKLSTGTGENTLIGDYCCGNMTTGVANTMCGSQIGRYTTSGGFVTTNYDVCLGSADGFGGSPADGLDSRLGIGYDREDDEYNQSNRLQIGGDEDSKKGLLAGDVSKTYISGITGKTSTSGVAIYCSPEYSSYPTGQLGTTTSNRDSKFDIADMGVDSSVINNLRARIFRFINDDEPKPKQYGLIAEEVEPIFPEMVLYDAEQKPWNLSYQFLAPLLVNEIQKLEKTVTALEAAVAEKGQ
jgi:hypothetical protein